jgi:hypothetical protein
MPINSRLAAENQPQYRANRNRAQNTQKLQPPSGTQENAAVLGIGPGRLAPVRFKQIRVLTGFTH